MSAVCSASLLSTKEARPLSLAIFYYLGFFGGTISPSSVSFSFLFFFKLGKGACQLWEEEEEREGLRPWNILGF